MGLLINHSLHYEKFPDGTVKCIEDEIPFELPEGWEWTRLGNLSSSIQYGLSNSAEVQGTHRLLRITDIQDGKVNWKEVPFTTVDNAETYLLRKDDIVFARTGATVGKSFLITELPFESVYASYLIRIRLFDCISPNYLYQFFNSHCYWEQITDKSVGVGQPNCNGTSLKELFIPLPPLNEQKRIVPAANALLEYASVIESEKASLQEIINLTKSKILDLAIRGKLVPQNPDDEPASVLLDRIRAEKEELIKQGKIKRDKKESVIFKGDDNSYYEVIGKDTENIDDDIPYDIPDGWAWCRIKDICQMNAGKSKPKDQIFPEPFNNCFPCYGGNGHRGYVDTYNYEGKYSIVGRQGALCGNVNTAEGKFYATEHAVVVTLFDKVNFEWSFFTLKTLNLNQYATGAAQPGLSVANIQNVFIPVPPLSEQKRIADKVSQLFSLLDSIAENVN